MKLLLFTVILFTSQITFAETCYLTVKKEWVDDYFKDPRIDKDGNLKKGGVTERPLVELGIRPICEEFDDCQGPPIDGAYGSSTPFDYLSINEELFHKKIESILREEFPKYNITKFPVGGVNSDACFMKVFFLIQYEPTYSIVLTSDTVLNGKAELKYDEKLKKWNVMEAFYRILSDFTQKKSIDDLKKKYGI